MRQVTKHPFLSALCLIFAATLASLSAGPSPQLPRQAVASWMTSPLAIDGKLDDPAWRQAKTMGGFVKVSRPGQRPHALTTVKFLCDSEALYLGFRCSEPFPDKILAKHKNHDDPVWGDDTVEIILDPDNTRSHLFHLIVNSVGARYDAEGKIALPETSNDDPKWDGDWTAACSRGAREWVAEARLPFKTFGINPKQGCVGLNLGRGRVGAEREDSSWSPTRIQYVNPAYLGELYIVSGGADSNQPLRVGLPTSLNAVRGTTSQNFQLVNPVAAPATISWTACVTSGSNKLEYAGTASVPAKGSKKVSLPLECQTIGSHQLHLKVRNGSNSETIYNGVRCFQVLPEIGIAEALYALQYHRAKARVALHLPAKEIRGMRLETALIREGEKLETRFEGARAGKTNVVCFDLRNREAGRYAIQARLLRGAEVVASAESRPLPYRPDPLVGFDPNGFLTVSGKPWFPVGLYTIQAREGSHDGVMEEARKAGFNTTVFYAYTVDTITPLLDAAQRHDLRAFVYPANPSRVREHKASRDELVGEIQARMHHPALLGWYLVDEPEGIGVASVQTVRDYYQLVKETDPSHPCSLVIMSPGAAANYGDSADIVWIDPYPIPHSPVTYVSECMDGAHDSIASDKPVWTIPQAFDWSVWRTGKVDQVHRPTPVEERCMTYLALVHGAKGIIYWAHTASKYYIQDYPEHWAALKQLAGELQQLSPVLLTTNSTSKLRVTPKSATLDMMVKEFNGDLYVFAVNREPAKVRAQFAFKRKGVPENVEVLFEERTLSTHGRRWTDEFKPLEVHVYRIRDGAR